MHQLRRMWDVELRSTFLFSKVSDPTPDLPPLWSEKLLWIFKIFNAVTHMWRQSWARPKLTLASIDFFCPTVAKHFVRCSTYETKNLRQPETTESCYVIFVLYFFSFALFIYLSFLINRSWETKVSINYLLVYSLYWIARSSHCNSCQVGVAMMSFSG
jgi:hypothetical protein